MASTIAIEETITVGDLADKLSLPVTKLIGELMKLGVMVTVNERIDFETAQIIVQELGLEIELQQEEQEEVVIKHEETVKGKKTIKRPPVVAVMGHVDHGKTSLLDAIKSSSVVKGEAGGITQHISAYQVEHNGRFITLLDTPGHEAFAALREHGAQLTDLAIIVVAADDGVKPQTIEAIRFAKKAGVKMLVAINKIDKPEANPNLVKQQLAEQNVMIEGWGGDVIAVEVSAKTKEGINNLLDMILLIADVEELEAYTDIPGTGLIIESHMEQGRGAVAEALVEGGELKPGDFIVAGSSYARIRNLESTDGKPIKTAGPSTPVVITGFKKLPEFGDRFTVVENEKVARLEASGTEVKRSRNDKLDMNSSELIRMINRSNKINEFNIIVKADVQGSLVSVTDSLKGLDTDEVAVRIIASGVGPISENDVNQAQSSQAIIYGFNVTMPKNIDVLSRRHDVTIRLFDIIYELIDDAKSELSELLEAEVVETDLGELKVKGIFKTLKTMVICGGEVTSGKLVTPALARVIRDKKVIAEEVEVVNLKRGPQDVKEVLEGEMCGISLKTPSKLDLAIDDTIQVFKRETIERSI
jgi:translation initiation factor IF-2